MMEGTDLIPLGTGSESATGLAHCSTSPPARELSGETPTGPWARELVKQIAMDIGKETVAYIEVMYPDAIKATSSTFKLSVRNHIYNQIMAAIEVNDEGEIKARLQDRKKFRRWWTATYRKIRSKRA